MGGGPYFWFTKDAVRDLLKRGGYLQAIGVHNILARGADPIATLYPQLDAQICHRCTARIFPQCREELLGGQPCDDANGVRTQCDDRPPCRPVTEVLRSSGAPIRIPTTMFADAS